MDTRIHPERCLHNTTGLACGRGALGISSRGNPVKYKIK